MNQPSIQNKIRLFESQNHCSLSIRVVFFDMDGVLFDSMPNHSYAWVSAFRKFGLEIPTREAYMNEGSTALFTAKNLFMKYLNQEISADKAEEIKKYKHGIMDSLPASPVMPFMPELIKTIAGQGIDRWVVTGSAQNILIDRLEPEFFGLLSVKKTVTAHDVKIGKPHPEPYLMALEKSGYLKNEVMVVENAPLGVLSAKAAGLFTIALNSGPLEPEVLTDAGADLWFADSQSLAQAWPSIVASTTI